MRCAKTPAPSTKSPRFTCVDKLVDDTREMHQLLARFAGCSDEEILLTRNTTESLNIVIMGLKLQPGDEALWGTYEYGSMKVAFEQRAAREGIVNKVLDLPITSMSNDEIVAAYKKAITPRTKVILVSPHRLFNRSSAARARNLRHGPRAGSGSHRRWCPRLCPSSHQNPRPTLRLLRARVCTSGCWHR